MPQNKKSSSQKTKDPAKTDPAAGDDRNLVAIDEAYKEASFEDRMNLFWQKYQGPLIVGGVLIVLCIVGWQVMGFVAERMDQRIRGEYAAIETTEDRLHFAQHRSGHLLSGIAYLELGDEAFAKEEFADAVEFYRQAANRLEEHEIRDRAQFSLAMALVENENFEEGRAELENLLDRAGALSVFREEARLALAVLLADDGQTDQAISRLKEIEGDSPNQIIRWRASNVLQGLE
ncbi:MAG: tetratricopeptide repeat protein [Opitutales bacterium]|nr:tetratricopeptide repeat protein [Opitutales bacterium]MCH8540438.1 tetratricopeptide repeat protein [Opitutales bacterium]